MKLEDIGNKDPFKVPEGYFEELPGQVMEKCRAEKKQTVVLRGWGVVRWGVLTSVAIMLIVITLTIVPGTKDHTSIGTTGPMEFDTSLMLADMDEEYLYDAVIENSTQEIEVFPEDMEYSEDAVIEYLLDEEVEMEIIIDEY